MAKKRPNDAWLETAREREIREPEGRTRGSPARCRRVPYLSWPSSAPKAPARSSRLGSAGDRGEARSGGAVENRFAETERATLRSIVRAWRRSDTETRACARRDGGECGPPRRSPSGNLAARRRRPGRAVSGGLERRASRRWRSSPRAYLRKKQLSRAINFLRRSTARPTNARPGGRDLPGWDARGRLEAVRCRALSMRSGMLREPRRTPKPRGRLSTRSANRHGGLDYSTPSRNERMLRSGSAPGETSGGAPRPRESRVEAGLAAAPCPDHAVAEIARSSLSAARARPARLKPRRAGRRGFFNRLRRRRERAVLVGLARFSRQIRPAAKVSEKIRPVSRRPVVFLESQTVARARSIDAVGSKRLPIPARRKSRAARFSK